MYQDQAGDRLDASMFPYVKDAPSLMPTSPRSPQPQTTSLRSQKPAWHRAPKSATVLDNRQRVLVFVAGGMAYSEIRETYQLSNSLQKDIYIGEFVEYHLSWLNRKIVIRLYTCDYTSKIY